MTASTAQATARVLHFVDALLRGGAERLVVELATRTDRQRFDPAVATFRQEAFAEELAAARRPVHVVPKRRPFDLRLVLALRRLLRRQGVALVHAHDIQSATYGALAARLVRVPVVLTVHGLGIFRQKRSATILPRLVRWLDRVAFVGHWLERAAAEDFGVRPRHPMVVHNGVDIEAFRPREPEPQVLAELGLDPDAPVVGTVGNLRGVKDYPCLLRAFAVARARVPGAVLVFVGDGEERARLEALAGELGVGPAVRFAGARSDVARLLPAFDLFALSSTTEGISVALLEAMACGLPPVVTRTGGNPEVVDEACGRLVPVGQPQALGEALAELLAEPRKRQALGAEARARVERDFSMERMVRDYEATYESLLSAR
ncbi:MAG: glycosyltransferase [Candidatus Brocadiia bacterium]